VTQQFPLWILKHGVAADLSAECHASIAKLHIRLNPPLHHVSKRSFMPKRKLLKVTGDSLQIIHYQLVIKKIVSN
jgi:hypothetical protein